MTGLVAPVGVVVPEEPEHPLLPVELRVTRERDVPPGEDGKGRAVWIALGYVLGTRRAQVIALHDCDIATYSRDMVARLVYPVADPDIDYEYSKGYYARLGDRPRFLPGASA